jgi:hypothetical protein
MSPVNARKLLGRADDCALSIIFPYGAYEPNSAADLWETARRLSRDLAGPRSAEGVAATYSALGQLIASQPGVEGIAEAELGICGIEMMVSNLGVLPYASRFGAFELKALWGPSVFAGVEREQMIGVATIGDAIHLLHTSYSAIPRLLDEVESILKAMSAGEPAYSGEIRASATAR